MKKALWICYSLYGECENNVCRKSMCVLRTVGQEKSLQFMQSQKQTRETQAGVCFSLQRAFYIGHRRCMEGKGK